MRLTSVKTVSLYVRDVRTAVYFIHILANISSRFSFHDYMKSLPLQSMHLFICTSENITTSHEIRLFTSFYFQFRTGHTLNEIPACRKVKPLTTFLHYILSSSSSRSRLQIHPIQKWPIIDGRCNRRNGKNQPRSQSPKSVYHSLK